MKRTPRVYERKKKLYTRLCLVCKLCFTAGWGLQKHHIAETEQIEPWSDHLLWRRAALLAGQRCRAHSSGKQIYNALSNHSCLTGTSTRPTLQRKSHLCVPWKGTTRPQSQFPHHIHVSVSDLYIPRIGPHIFLQQNRQTSRGNI